MSISDFSLSSPRKGTGRNRDKSITYDEEFEKFLNDTSESDLSTNRYKKKSNLASEKPWWMKDEDSLNVSASLGATKSFIKKPKLIEPTTKRLGTTLESDEFNHDNQTNKFADTGAIEMPNLSFDNNSSISELKSSRKKTDDEDNYEIDNFEEDETSTAVSSPHQSARRLNSERNMRTSSVKSSQASLRSVKNSFDKIDESYDSVSSKKEVSELSRPSNLKKSDNSRDEPTSGRNNETNLLSKDSLTSGEMGKTGTLNMPFTNKPSKQVQINESHNIRLGGTETRRDLADLEQVYRDLALHTDSGLNTMLRTNLSNSSTFNRDQGDNNNISNRESYENYNSDFGNQTIHAIKEELEAKALEEILRQIENQSKPKDSKSKADLNQSVNKTKNLGWPPDKYSHIKGSGYGTSWQPKSKSSQLNESLNQSLRDSRQQMSKTTRILSPSPHSRNQENLGFSKHDMDMQNYVISLKNDLVDRVESHNEYVKKLRLDYEDQLNDLREQVGHLTTEVNSKTKKLEEKLNLHNLDAEVPNPVSNQKYELLEKNYKEQEKLIKGYQLENERLCTEIKQLKELQKTETKRLSEEVKTLKYDLIHEKNANEKNLKSAIEANNKIPSINESDFKKILPTTDKSVCLSEYEAEIEFLNSKILHLKEENNRLNTLNKTLTDKNDYFNKNQRQIDMDLNVIRSKNKEIKKLNDKLKLLETGKLPVDCLRQQKIMKNQLKEMELLVKRLRAQRSQGNDENDVDSVDAVCLSIDFYQKKIEQLEVNLKEKNADLERCYRASEQKMAILKDLLNNSQSPQVDIDFRLNEIETNYIIKIEKLENLTLNLKKINNEFETRFTEKQLEFDHLKSESNKKSASLRAELDAVKNNLNNIKNIENKKQVKDYEPNEFEDAKNEYDPQDYKRCKKELNSLKLKMSGVTDELKKNNLDQEESIQKVAKLCETKLLEMKRAHKYEVDKIIKVLTGGPVYQQTFDDINLPADSFLNDPIQVRLLLNARDRNQEMKETIEKQKELIMNLNSQCNDLGYSKERADGMEEINQRLNDEINELKQEVSEMRSFMSPQSNSYDFLKQKIKCIENGFAKRERELQILIMDPTTTTTTNSVKRQGEDTTELKRFYEKQLDIKNQEIKKFKNEFDSILQLLHAL